MMFSLTLDSPVLFSRQMKVAAIPRQARGEPQDKPQSCCREWERSAWRLKVVKLHPDGMRAATDQSVKFCPWCGRAM